MRDAVFTRTRLLTVFGICILPVLIHLAIVETSYIRLTLALNFESLFKLGFVAVSAITYWAMYSGLFLTFALTLRQGHEPLITAMARKMHGSLPGELADYTRRVTIAWSYFFAAQLVMSISLFFFAPLVVWSFFVNILDIPLVVAMFSAEYACRLRCLQDPPLHSLSAILNIAAELRKPREGTTIPL